MQKIHTGIGMCRENSSQLDKYVKTSLTERMKVQLEGVM